MADLETFLETLATLLPNSAPQGARTANTSCSQQRMKLLLKKLKTSWPRVMDFFTPYIFLQEQLNVEVLEAQSPEIWDSCLLAFFLFCKRIFIRAWACLPDLTSSSHCPPASTSWNPLLASKDILLSWFSSFGTIFPFLTFPSSCPVKNRFFNSAHSFSSSVCSHPLVSLIIISMWTLPNLSLM